MGRIKGNTLIEAIFSFMIVLMIMSATSSLFRNLSKIKFNYYNDLSYCLYSLTQEVILANSIEVFDQQLILHTSTNDYQFELNNQRLVRTPGFNIYINDINDLCFSHDDTYVYMEIRKGNKNEKYKIGIYKRPIPRDDKSSSDDCIYDDDIIDNIIIDDVE